MIFSSLLRTDAAAAHLPHRGRHRMHAHRTGRARASTRPGSERSSPAPVEASIAPPDVSAKPAPKGSTKPHTDASTKVRTKRKHGARTLLLVVAVALVAAAAGAWRPYAMFRDESARAQTLESQLAAAQTELQASSSTAQAQSEDLSQLQARLSQVQASLAQARQAKVHTVVEEKVVTKEVLRWVPSGEDVSVEITGFEDLISVADVHLTHAFGYTNLVGIAVNQGDVEITYAQLGCTFLDAKGNVTANAMTNKQGWMPGQSWGFSCSAQVDATGGIVRVDEMS